MPRFKSKFCQLHATSSFQKVMRECRIFGNVFQEQLPLDFEPVVEDLIVRNLLPVLPKAEGVFDVWVPDRSRRVDAMLRSTFTKAGNGAAECAVHLQAEEFIAVDAKRPGGVDLRNDTAIEFKRPVSRVVCGALITLSLLIHPLGDRCAAKALHRTHSAEGMVQNIAPMAEHVHDDAAVVFLAVVPGGPLRGLPVSLEHPVPKLATNGMNSTEEAAVHQPLQLAHAGQKELVLHNPVLHACSLGLGR